MIRGILKNKFFLSFKMTHFVNCLHHFDGTQRTDRACLLIGAFDLTNVTTCPQGLLAFQYGGGSGEDPGTQQNHVTKISNEDGNVFKMAAKAKRVRKSGNEITTEVKRNKMAEKSEGWLKHA